jgi:hypothetical protein
MNAGHNFGDSCLDAGVLAEVSDILALLADDDARIARADERPEGQRVAGWAGRRRASCARRRVMRGLWRCLGWKREQKG